MSAVTLLLFLATVGAAPPSGDIAGGPMKLGDARMSCRDLADEAAQLEAGTHAELSAAAANIVRTQRSASAATNAAARATNFIPPGLAFGAAGAIADQAANAAYIASQTALAGRLGKDVARVWDSQQLALDRAELLDTLGRLKHCPARDES